MDPIVQLVPASKAPVPPAGMKPTQIGEHLTPVIYFRGYAFWPFDFNDNRMAFALIAYDNNENIVTQWEWRGPRYITSIESDPKKRTVSFFGQSYKSFTMSWDELMVDDPI